MMLITPTLMQRITGCTEEVAMRWAPALHEACQRFGLTTERRLRHFLVQSSWESARFTAFVENMNYSAEAMMRTWPGRIPNRAVAAQYVGRPAALANHVYGGRNGNGPAISGDGWKYRGRGPIQITGRENYRLCENVTRVPCLLHPELLEQPAGGALSAAWYFATRCLVAADADDAAGVIRGINPGEHRDRVTKRVALAQAARAATTEIA